MWKIVWNGYRYAEIQLNEGENVFDASLKSKWRIWDYSKEPSGYTTTRHARLSKAECLPRECCQLKEDAKNPSFDCMHHFPPKNKLIIRYAEKCTQGSRKWNCEWNNHAQCRAKRAPTCNCQAYGEQCDKDYDCCSLWCHNKGRVCGAHMV